MKLSLILQAVDRWSKPTKDAAQATRGLTGTIAKLDPAAEKARGRVRRFFNDMEYAERVSGRWGRSLRRVAERDFATLRAGIDRTRAKVRSLTGDMAKWSLRSAGSALKWGAVGVGGGLAAGATAGIFSMFGKASQFEQYQVALEGTEGSAKKARAAMAWVQQFAKDTPYDIDTVTDSFVRARGVGIDPMTGSLRILGDAAGSTRKSLMDAVEAIADAQTGEFERLKEFNITSSSKGPNVTFSYLTKAGKNATVTVKKDMASIRKAVLDVFDTKYGGGMKRQAQTLSGIWNNLSDVVTNFQLAVAGKGIFDKVKTRLQSVLDWTTQLQKDGRLDAWAQSTSDWLVELFDKADRFVHDVDWRAVAAGIGTITSALITAVEWIGKAASAWGSWQDGIERRRLQTVIDSNGVWGTGIGAPSAGEKRDARTRLNNLDRGQFGQPQARQRGGFVEWPTAGAGRARPSAPWATETYRRNTWRRAMDGAGGGGKPTAAMDGRFTLDVNLRGDGAKGASVVMVKAPQGGTMNVNRGRAMGGEG